MVLYSRLARALAVMMCLLSLTASPATAAAQGGAAVITATFTATSVTVTSTKDLSNVVLVFCDGTTQKFDGLRGKTGTFAGTGDNSGKGISDVYVKSGNNDSGAGPGYGEHFASPLDCRYAPQPIAGAKINKAAGTSSLTSGSTSPGTSVTTVSTGWKPETKVKAVLHSEPMDLGTIAVDREGRLEESLSIPDSAPPGAHTVTLTGTDKNGQQRGDVIPLVITDAAALSATTQGTGPTLGTLALGLLIATMGAGQLIRRQRRMRDGYGY